MRIITRSNAVAAKFVRQWVELMLRYLTNSDYLAGMLAMSAMGVFRDAAARAAQLLLAWIMRRLWVTVRLEEKDAELVLAWLRERPEVQSCSQLMLYVQRGSEAHVRSYEYEPEIQVTTRLRCAIKPGGRGQWIWITRRDRGDANGERRLLGAMVSFFGRDKLALEHILEKGREIQRQKREKYLTVVQVYDYGKEHGLNWLHPQEKDRKQPGRSISSVVLPRCPTTGLDQADALLEDAREFLASELWYTERGIPYRRGYMLHGIPGGGKSSLVMAVASELRLPIYMLQLSSEQMSDDTLNSLLQYGMHDPPTILLLEDVDLLHSAVLERRRAAIEDEAEERREDLAKQIRGGEDNSDRKGRRGKLTLSGLLNALDGPTATTGRLLFMTTNNRERLDPALVRSGRIDYEVEFTHAEPEQIQRLFARFYSNFRSGGSSGSRSSPSNAGSKATLDTADVHVSNCSATDEAAAALERVSSGASSGRSTEQLAIAFSEQMAASGLKLTTADIQRHLMKFKSDPERALKELPSLLRRGEEKKGAIPASTASVVGPSSLDGAGSKNATAEKNSVNTSSTGAGAKNATAENNSVDISSAVKSTVGSDKSNQDSISTKSTTGTETIVSSTADAVIGSSAGTEDVVDQAIASANGDVDSSVGASQAAV